jgi:hypothetical protein
VKEKLVLAILDKIDESNQCKFYGLTIILLLKSIGMDAKIKLNDHDISSKLYEISNTEFKISKKLLWKSLCSSIPIQILTHFTMLINYISIFSPSDLPDLHKKVRNPNYFRTKNSARRKVKSCSKKTPRLSRTPSGWRSGSTSRKGSPNSSIWPYC